MVGNRLCVIIADIIVLVSTWVRTFRTRQEMVRLGQRPGIVHLMLRDGQCTLCSIYAMLSLIMLQVPSAFCKITLISTPMLVSWLMHRSTNQSSKFPQYHPNIDGSSSTSPWIMTTKTSKLNQLDAASVDCLRGCQ